jgi:GTP-binding protein Era
MKHKAGFVSIIGKPNVGKSTLMNALVGEKISIISPKVQTTRHRIMGILTEPGYQVVFSDTPGIIDPVYKLHGSMMQFVNESLADADIVAFITDAGEPEGKSEEIIARLKLIKCPLLVILNKIDTLPGNEDVLKKIAYWNEQLSPKEVIPVSALNRFNINMLKETIVSLLPENPPYYPEDQITDRSERFIAAEIIREKIMTRYKEEIPYSVQVEVVSFKEMPGIIHIEAELYVMRESQKQIMIGKGGNALKSVGMAARRDMEKFFGKQIFLKTFVKVKDNWRDDDRLLKQFGYKE